MPEIEDNDTKVPGAHTEHENYGVTVFQTQKKRDDDWEYGWQVPYIMLQRKKRQLDKLNHKIKSVYDFLYYDRRKKLTICKSITIDKSKTVFIAKNRYAGDVGAGNARPVSQCDRTRR